MQLSQLIMQLEVSGENEILIKHVFFLLFFLP